MKCNKKKDISFDNRADKYDSGFEGKLSKRFYSDLIDSIEINDGDVVLDVGCGTGTILKQLSNKVKITGYGVDVSDSMLDKARIKCQNMDFQISDCGKLPFTDCAFDVIITCLAYHHFSKQELFRKEALRTLKHGGKIYICDPRFPWLVRKCLNGIFRLSKTQARFYNSDEIVNDFNVTGFTAENVIKDWYVQVIIMKKP